MTFDCFQSSQNALHYMNDINHPDPFPSRYTANGSDGRRKSRRFAFDTHQEIYRPQRFEEISTVVANYFSHGMTGLEFFEKVKNPHIQKILLIEEGEEEIAREAFRKGLIHQYVSKKDFDWCEQLHEALQNAQWQYFTKLSEVFMEDIRDVKGMDIALVDPNFQKFFKAILTDYGFTEAYLCETTGSYLFLDQQAQDHGLVVNIAEQLDLWVRTGQDKGINLPLLKALKDRKKMMCYHTQFGALEPDKGHWEIYAHPANTLKGQKNLFYYAFAPNMYDIDLERVLPFEDYRENQQRKVNTLH